jgi:conjugative transfer signal peptidase TraF
VSTVRPVGILVIAALSVLAIAPLAASRLIVNLTPSVPVGVYRIEHRAPARGDFVLLALTPKYRDIAVARGYLRQEQHLLKNIAAMDGDQVCRRGLAVWINGHIRVWLRRTDGSGRTLSGWQGCRRLRNGELFVLGTDRSSFDSRYFGPILRSDIIAVAGPWWVLRRD